jgi:hypothetical protein
VRGLRLLAHALLRWLISSATASIAAERDEVLVVLDRQRPARRHEEEVEGGDRAHSADAPIDPGVAVGDTSHGSR